MKKGSLRVINILSIVIPLAVAAMLGIRKKLDFGIWTDYLPHFNAAINSATAFFLILALIAIKRKNIPLHKLFTTLGFGLGALFLLAYIGYHITHESTTFGGRGLVRMFYYFVLITHILGSLIVLPFVLRAYYYGYNRMDAEHLKITKIAFPLWLYVSITGVVAYYMIKPYYMF
ncbi:MAG: DUF420 domain-containing protein [Leadbetterella sp.]